MPSGDRLFRSICFCFALLILILLCLLFIKLIIFSIPSFKKFGLSFIINSTWDPVAEEFGALPFIYGTVVSSVIAVLIATPLSLWAAIFLSELSPRWLERPLSFLIELLAAIPSVVYGLWGIFVLVPVVRDIEIYLMNHLPFIPIFQGPAFGVGMLSGAIILAIMIIPTITAISREALMTVPDELREAALALGSTRWEAIRMVVIPYSKSGLLGGILLGLGRALGETMAITMVIGNRPEISLSLFAPSYTMASVIANEFTEATTEVYLSALIEIGLILFIITFLLNLIARLIIGSTKFTGARGL